MSENSMTIHEAFSLAVESVTRMRSFSRGIIAIMVLNFFDAFCTLYWASVSSMGNGVETNPVMRAALEEGNLVFVLYKITLVSLGVLLLWRFRKIPTARIAFVPVALLYALVAGGHIGSLIYIYAPLPAPQVLFAVAGM